MELSTKNYSHVILTWKGTRFFLTKEQNENLKSLSLNKLLQTDNGIVSTSAIREIITIQQWKGSQDYTQYLEKLENKNYSVPVLEFCAPAPTPAINNAKERIKKGFIDYHLEQGRSPEEAEKKWNIFVFSKYEIIKNI